MTRGPGLGLLFVVTVAISTLALLSLVSVILTFIFSAGPLPAWRALVAALASAGAILVVITVLQVILVSRQRSTADRQSRSLRRWEEVWAAVAAGAKLRTVPVIERQNAAEACARMIDQVVGDAAGRMRWSYRQTGLVKADVVALLRDPHATSREGRAALERLARIVPDETLPVLLRASASRDVRIARAALLGAARIVAGREADAGVAEDLVACALAHVRQQRQPDSARTTLTATVMACGRHLSRVAEGLLAAEAPEPVYLAALDAIGLARAPEGLAAAAAELHRERAPEIRAAALRALYRVGSVPVEAVPAVLAAAASTHVGVRVQAAYTLTLVTGEAALQRLWTSLGDANWDVRRAAAVALLQSGSTGEDRLRLAAVGHEDRFARDISVLAMANGLESLSPPQPPAVTV